MVRLQRPNMAQSLNNRGLLINLDCLTWIALTCPSQGKYEEAHSLCLRAVEIGERVLDPDHQRLAIWLNTRAWVLTKLVRPILAVGLEGSKRSIFDPLFIRRHVSGYLPYRQSDRVCSFCFCFLCSFCGRLISGSRAGESQFKTTSCPCSWALGGLQ